MVNEHYALEVGRKVRQTKQMNMRKGRFVGRFAPYGYIKSEENKYKLIPDPYAAVIVKKMFEMAAEGKSVTEIAEWLNGGGILPPKRYLHSTGQIFDSNIEKSNAYWNIGVIYSILKNRAYCGDMVQGKFQTHSYVRKAVPKTDWVIIENTHEAIVSRELFEKVQLLWADSKPRNSRTPYSPNIFSKKVFCGHCGYALIRSLSKSGIYSLLCNSRRAYSKNACVPVSIGENDLKEVLLEMLEKQAEVFGVGYDYNTHKPPSKECIAEKAELQQVLSDLNKNSNFLKSLYESLITGDITQDEYRELKDDYEKKITVLKAKKKNLQNNIAERIAKESATGKAVFHLKEVRQVTDLTAASIDKLIDKILIYKGKHIEVRFKFSDGLTDNSSVVIERGVCIG
jgi:hypothetical protein